METPTFSGRYSDGRTAATHPVTVHLGDALEFSGPNSPGPETWAYSKLQTATPLHWKDNEALLRFPGRPGATLFVANPGFVSALLKRAPHLSSGGQRWRYALPGLLIVAALLLAVGAMFVFSWQPARALASLIPYNVRVAIGEKAAMNLSGDHAICTSPEGNKALDQMVARLSSASGSANPFHVRVVHWDILNAFAVPGGQIVVSGDLIKEADSPDEVAGVLAHEMGHGLELHPESGIIRTLGLSAIIELFASGQSGTLSNVGALLIQLHYSREAEHEADVDAMRILHDADISPRPLAVFFRRLLKHESADGDGAADKPQDKSGEKDKTASRSIPPADLSIFSTHPPTPERAKMAEEAATYPGKPSLDDAGWQALKHICD